MTGDIIISDNTITAEILDQIASEVQNRLSQTAKDPGDWEEVNTLTGISSLPVFQVSGSVYRLVRVAVSILHGTDGREVELQVTATHIQWRYTNGEWNNLVALSALKGDKGETPTFRTGSAGIEWKYQSEADTAYKVLVAYDTLKLKFTDLTPEQKEELKLHFSDLTEEDIATLQQPAQEATAAANQAAQAANQAAGSANEAAATAQETNQSVTAAEALRVEAETARDTAEQQRTAAEQARSEAEAARATAEAARAEAETLRATAEQQRAEAEEGRQTNETTRQSQESTRQSQETKRQTDTQEAIQNAETATAAANTAAQRANTAAEAAENIVAGISPDWLAQKGTANYIRNKPELPTLDAAPTEETLSYVNTDGTTVAYTIGDEVRYFDPDLSEYVFYKLHDITSDEKAVWQESGSGGKFKGEEVAIAVTSDQGDPDVALFGMLFTVKIGVKESYYPYNGAPIIVEVERGKECTITPPEREGYLTPEAQSFIADMGERTVTFAYKGVCVITFNQLLDTPENITVTSGSILTKLEQAARKRYLVKQTTNGTVAAPLLASNTAFFEDSAAAPILGTDGDVMNPLPEFYYKIERDEAAKEVLLYIAENDPDGTYKHIPASWVGTYKASLLDGKLRSISGAEPCRGEVWNDLKAAATAHGEGFELIGYDQHCVIALLLYGLYKTRDIRYQLGTGGATYDANLTTGSTNQTGNADTRATNTIAGYISGLGIEGVYGGLYEYMDRIYKLKDEWHITEADGTERIVTTPAGLQGWTKRMRFEISDTFDLIPSETGASSSTGYTTFFEAAYSEWLPIRAARSGFTAGDDNPDVGVSYLNALDMGNTSSPFYGTRLAYRGEVTIVTPSEYREMEN